MTAARANVENGYGNLARRLGTVISDERFWIDVRKNVASWAIIGSIGGIGWLSFSVPSRLDRVLLNQESFKIQVNGLRSDIMELQDLRRKNTERIERLERIIK